MTCCRKTCNTVLVSLMFYEFIGYWDDCYMMLSEQFDSFRPFDFFQSPLMPLIPLMTILINALLIVRLPPITWLRFFIWSTIGEDFPLIACNSQIKNLKLSTVYLVRTMKNPRGLGSKFSLSLTTKKVSSSKISINFSICKLWNQTNISISPSTR